MSEIGLADPTLQPAGQANRVHLYRIETGRQSMTLRTLKIIADALDVRMHDLIGNL
jgi:transcriptional regulator with XRE-family HTH domain